MSTELGHRNDRVRYFALKIIRAAEKIQRLPKVLRSPVAAFQGWWIGFQVAREARTFKWDLDLFIWSIKCYIAYFDRAHLEHTIE